MSPALAGKFFTTEPPGKPQGFAFMTSFFFSSEELYIAGTGRLCIFFNFSIKNCGIVDLQCCVSFRCIASESVIYIPTLF